MAAYREVLQEYTRERVPLDWAMTQHNLGNTLSTLGERENNAKYLTAAITALEAVQSVYQQSGLAPDATDVEKKLQLLRQRVAQLQR